MIDRSPGFHEGYRRGRALGRRQGRRMWFCYGFLMGCTLAVVAACGLYVLYGCT